MPSYPKLPVIDVHNPCYCPSLPAHAYIHNLHQGLARNSLADLSITRSLRVINPFTRLLAQTVNTPGVDPGDKGVLDSDSETSGSGSHSDASTSTVISRSPASDDNGSGNEQFHSLPSCQPACMTSAGPAQVAQVARIASGTLGSGTGTTENISFDSNLHLIAPGRFGGLRDSHLLARPPRKRKDPHHPSDSEGSDIRGPPKHVKSAPATEQRSFEVRLKREPLNFDLPSSGHTPNPVGPFASPPSSPASVVDIKVSRPQKIQVELLPRGLSESKRLLEEIKEVAPGIRIPYDAKSVSLIAAYLAENGLLTPALMRVIGRYPIISKLSLSPSLQEYNGLNLGRVPDLLPALHTPGLFTGLTSLACDHAFLNDDDVMYFHNLPLRSLSLRDTHISNAAIYMLVSHRHTLLLLSIGSNSSIGDYAVPALVMFERLKHLEIDGTIVSIKGLRNYASALHLRNQTVRVEIPESCRMHIESMDREYLVNIQPPLISDWRFIGTLSLVELRRNLAAHSVANRRILTTGNKADLRERLFKILKEREEDLRVMEMLEKGKALDAELTGDERVDSGGVTGTSEGEYAIEGSEEDD